MRRLRKENKTVHFLAEKNAHFEKAAQRLQVSIEKRSKHISCVCVFHDAGLENTLGVLLNSLRIRPKLLGFAFAHDSLRMRSLYRTFANPASIANLLLLTIIRSRT